MVTPVGTSAAVAADRFTYVSMAVIRFEETDARLVYAGTWTALSNAAYSGGSLRYTANAGTSVTAKFTGASLALIARMGPSYGIARITVDGGAPILVDLYSSAFLNQQAVWNTGVLANGAHTVVISWTGQRNPAATFTYVDIDAVDVAGSLN